MRIYLAGNDDFWREDIVTGLADTPVWQGQCDETQWPTLKRSVLHHYDYVGPYIYDVDDESEVDLRLSAIRRADLVFAWLPTIYQPTAITEIGFAMALPACAVFLGAPPFMEDVVESEMWFPKTGANGGLIISETPADGLRQVLTLFNSKDLLEA